MTMLISPYADPAVAEAYEDFEDRADAHGRGSQDRALRYLAAAFTTLGGALAAGLVWSAEASGTAQQDAMPMIYLLAALWAIMNVVIFAPILMSEVWLALHKRAGRALGEEVLDISNYPLLAQDNLTELADDLSSLPASMRAELRPLWSAALVAADAIAEDDGDDEAWLALGDRMKAVRAVMVQQENLELAAQVSPEPALPSAKQKLADLDNSDLKLAENYATALQAGRERVKEIN